MGSDVSLPASFVEALLGRLAPAEERLPTLEPRPVHVVYGGAHLFSAGSPDKLGARARAAMETWGADPTTFARAIGVTADDALASAIATRVRDKLARRPIEAICIDFEDGYGARPDSEEDADAVRTATELGKVPSDGPIVGMRIKALASRTAGRAVRTLDLFVSALARATSGAPRPGFTVTLPKITGPDEIAILVDLLEQLEATLGLPRIGVELMIESPRALVDPRGGFALQALIEAARGRAVAVHLGAYDLVGELGVTAGAERLDHPYCDFARLLLQLILAGSSVAVSDGVTTTLPIAPKDRPPAEAASAVHHAWGLHAANVRRAIDVGIWQGWDVHPAQVPARYGALFAHFLSRREEVAVRLRNFVERATQASRVGQVFDDAATAHGLMSFFRRGLACGALGPDDLHGTTLTASELALSFADIARARSAVRSA